ncbi:MAG: TetR/AcrR family transcriptional regulator [Pseudomonadota bacterium]|nr:TetR/AcrR family transcriptional regulator [Pseudomonadota bacterium]
MEAASEVATRVGNSKGEQTRDRILDVAKTLILARGYSGTSLDDILKASGLTKGAFFYHFRSKNELARALIGKTWAEDHRFFDDMARRAREMSDDPLQAALIFLRLFEEELEANLHSPFSCLFASYLYESEQFDGETRQFLSDGLGQWVSIYESMFAPIFETRQPRIRVTARELAQTIASVLEGGFILSKAQGDSGPSIATARQFREHLKLVFAD